MRTKITLAFSVCIMSLTSFIQAQVIADKGPDKHLLFHTNDIDWQPGPPSLPNGAEFAVLEGDPSEEGLFTMRLKLPDGYEISPHWHPNVERVSIISGKFHLGMGEKMNKSETTSMEAGSYTSMPPEMVHFAYTEGETVVQLTSIGPWKINYIKEEDDPRKK